MRDTSWRIMVWIEGTTVGLTDQDGQSLDKTTYRGETNTITFSPSSGVRSVDSLTITSPNPLPASVSISQVKSNRNLIVTDIDDLASDSNAVEVVYCLHVTDSYGNPKDSDPKLINMPILRPH